MSAAREQPGTARRALPRRELLLLAVLILLLVLGTVPPLINLGRFQRRIAGAISHAIGRPVSVDSIALQLLPWPGFQLQNMMVGEDPGFGQEPALRAPEVILEPSLSSLWRGRFEISKVEISNASVNLVRDSNGRWNISSVLLQASHIPNAPTGAAHHGSTPRFPYIEAHDIRINFKRAAEKLPFSLLDADFSMWLASPGAWRLRLNGTPARTDLALASSDMGEVSLNGVVHRATDFGQMPVALEGEWRSAPLGQASRLLLGRDTGWRGDADLHARFRGAADSLSIQAQLTIADLHRQDFTPAQSFDVNATCRGHYSRGTPALDSLLCRWPLGDGALSIASTPLQTSPGQPAAARAVSLTADQVPVQVAAAVLGLLHPGMPPPGFMTGVMDGTLTYDTGTGRVTGSLETPQLGIADAGRDGAPLTLAHVELTGSTAPGSLSVRCDPVPLGVPLEPLQLSALLDPHHYSLSMEGGAALESLDGAASALHLHLFPHLADSDTGKATALLALTLVGPWMEAGQTVGGEMTGTVRLSDVAWQPGWLTNSVDLPTATVAFAAGVARWTIPLATLETGTGAPLRLAGTMQEALDCPDCKSSFAVSLPAISTTDIANVLSAGHGGLLASLIEHFDPAQVRLPPVHGTVHLQQFTLGRMDIENATVVLSTDRGPQGMPTIRVDGLDGQALGGMLHLGGTITASSTSPVYTLNVALTGAAAQQAAALWGRSWGPGTFSGTATFTLAGTDAASLESSARGSFQASWQNGRLGRVVPHFNSWDAAGTLGPAGLLVQKGTLSGTPATLTGTIGWDRSLKLSLAPGPGAAAELVTGTLAAPLAGPAAPQP